MKAANEIFAGYGTTVFEVILNVIDHGMSIQEAVAAPRVHHQWRPDVLVHERGISPDTLSLLESKGHQLKAGPAMGSTQSVLIGRDGKTTYGSSDPRRPGALSAGPEK